jgi:mRNA interferase RelE/StbE
MVYYSDSIRKNATQGIPPKEWFIHFDNAFRALDLTGDYALFDIRKIQLDKKDTRDYYRLRKGKYRALFYRTKGDIFVIAFEKREDIYRKWA